MPALLHLIMQKVAPAACDRRVEARGTFVLGFRSAGLRARKLTRLQLSR